MSKANDKVRDLVSNRKPITTQTIVTKLIDAYNEMFADSIVISNDGSLFYWNKATLTADGNILIDTGVDLPVLNIEKGNVGQDIVLDIEKDDFTILPVTYDDMSVISIACKGIEKDSITPVDENEIDTILRMYTHELAERAKADDYLKNAKSAINEYEQVNFD
jgi:hypothetical protein